MQKSAPCFTSTQVLTLGNIISLSEALLVQTRLRHSAMESRVLDFCFFRAPSIQHMSKGAFICFKYSIKVPVD